MTDGDGEEMPGGFGRETMGGVNIPIWKLALEERRSEIGTKDQETERQTQKKYKLRRKHYTVKKVQLRRDKSGMS